MSKDQPIEDSEPRLFYFTNGGVRVYLDSEESAVKREDVVNWHDDGQVGVLRDGSVCF